RRQIIPTWHETRVAPGELSDPLGEDSHSPTPAIFHKYPDRVLLMVVDRCAIYCRHCNRRRLVGGDSPPTRQDLEAAFEYIARTRRIRDVLISGGDPLLMSDASLDQLLGRLRAIPHIEFVRLGTRIPGFLPQRITPELVKVLRKHRAWLSLHFCHVRELTPEVAEACDRLADGGIPLGCQTVLLRGVNDSVEALRDLFHGLLKLRVRPYYLYQADPVVGTGHLRTTVEKGLELMDQLRGHTTGYAVPTYVVDAPGGGGKVPLQSRTILDYSDGQVKLRNWAGQTYNYPDPVEHR
ncbi:MAG: KamA family radical SAM protein, partial [Thermoanaerobaculia bacterium]